MTRVKCHDTEQWCKIWKTYLLLQKWYEEFGEFSCKNSKVWKLELWRVPFIQNVLMYELKSYRRVMCNDTEEWCRIWREIDLSFEKWHEEIGEFWPGPLEICLKICTLNNDAKFEEEPTWYCKNDMRTLVNLYASTRKSQNLHFDGVPIPKEYKALTKKLQRSYVSSHWTVMQNLKKNLLVVAKMIWEIWQIFMKAL